VCVLYIFSLLYCNTHTHIHHTYLLRTYTHNIIIIILLLLHMGYNNNNNNNKNSFTKQFPQKKKMTSLVGLATNGGGVTSIPSAPQFQQVPPSNNGCNTGCCSQSPYDVDQWMPGQKSEVTVSIFGEIEDVKEAEKLATAFSRHYACVRPKWELNIVRMSEEDYQSWISGGEMKEFAENLKNAEEAYSHSRSDGPFVAIGDRYIGSTEKLREEIKKKTREFMDMIEYKSKSQQRRLVYAILAIVLIIGLCYLVLYVAFESGKWFESSNSFRNQLIQFYEKHNPEKLASIDSILKKYKGKEAKLMSVLRDKYGEL
jgi:hypothetical protein